MIIAKQGMIYRGETKETASWHIWDLEANCWLYNHFNVRGGGTKKEAEQEAKMLNIYNMAKSL